MRVNKKILSFMLLTLILISINANAFALSNDSNTITTIEQIKSVEVASGSSQNDRPVAKITHSCNVRNNAGANNKLLGKVKVGQTYFVLEQKKAPNGKVWYKINYKVNNSWICSSFCTITQGKLPTVSNNKDGNKNGNDNTKNTTKTTTANNTNNSIVSNNEYRHGKLIGTFKATAYCACEGGGENYYTADGFSLKGKSRTDAMTIAVDKKIIPLGTKVYIEFPAPYQHFNGYYTAHDTGGAIQGYKIDLYMGTNNIKDMNNFGVRNGLKIYYA